MIAYYWSALAAGLLALLLGAGALTYLVLVRRLVVVTGRGTSMEPAYRDGDRVLVRRSMSPAQGRVVVVRQPPTGIGHDHSHHRWIVKRVVAVPGDLVPREHVPALAGVQEHRVPAGKLVLLGDNADVSVDSRQLGYFPTEQVSVPSSTGSPLTMTAATGSVTDSRHVAPPSLNLMILVALSSRCRTLRWMWQAAYRLLEVKRG
jgi:signal peptidase I